MSAVALRGCRKRLMGAVAVMALAGTPTAAQQSPAPLTRLQFDIIGVRLVVDPPALTVPKNIATQINTSLVTPSAVGADVSDAIAALVAGAQVEAQLRGPSLPPTRIAVVPGQPLPIPPLAVPGDYFLDGIRLEKDGQTILDATSTDNQPATTIPIHVISEVLVASVTSQPLSLDDIRSKGIVIDEKNFSAVNFQVAFNIDGTPFTISAPAVLPTAQLLQQTSDRAQIIQQISVLNRSLAAAQTALPAQFDRPGLNFSIAALPFFPSSDNDGGDPGFDTPPVTGLIVIPGNVAFLHQFFSALLLVANVAPDGTTLTLQNVNGTITLPTGLDRVAGTYDQPGDDPLRLARIDGVGVQPTVVIAQRGPDGQLGTADDVPIIQPQKQGEGEFLIEGLQEGSQFFDIAIKATLVGLPSGPVNLEGQASGAVFVRNPTVSVTLAHPRTVRAGEPYELYATVTNTSRTAANLVSVNLDPRSISGAQLLSDSAVTFDTIAPGQSAVAKYSMKAQLTGDVDFTSFTGDAALGGAIRLVTGVDERGAPLAANAIVLPTSTDFLPAALIEAAQRVLGQAFSIATAPAEALPADVLFVKRQTVIDRGVELAEAGERVKFGEPLTRVIDDLLLDWLGNVSLDAGFDQILRTTDAGAEFFRQIADIIAPQAAGASVLAYQQQFAQATVSRSAHLSAIASGPPGSPMPSLTIAPAAGGITPDDEAGGSSLVSGAALALAADSSTSAFDIVAVPVPDRYRIQLVAPVNGTYDLGIVVPATTAGHFQQLVFPGVALQQNGIEQIELDLTGNGQPTLSVDRDADGTIDQSIAPTIVAVDEQPPQLIAVRQLESSTMDSAGGVSDPASYGLLVGALFDRPVSQISAEFKSNYQIASNAVIGAALQHSGRLVYLYLQKPIGGLTPRSLSASGITDTRGNVLASATQPIAMVVADGAHVFGQVRDAGGSGVGGGVLKLTVFGNGQSFDVAAFPTDAQGGFDFDFVPRLGDGFTLTAQHPVTRELAAITARVQGTGQQILLNPTFLGRGTVRGRLIGPSGIAIVNTPIALIPGSVLGARGFQTSTNALGEFTFADVPVGVFTLTAADASGAFGQAIGLLARAGDTVAQDLQLVAQPDAGGRLVGRAFLSDGATPGSSFTVYVGKYRRDNATIAALDQTTTDSTGSFAFGRTLPTGSYDVVAVDPASGQLGAASATIVAQTTSSVSIVLESTGAVEGVVFNGRGEPVAGALVAGGAALGTTTANGFFHIDGVPAGTHTIEAGDPVTRRRGSAQVTVLPGQIVNASITLESRATIVGRVLDANGNPVPGASVRIPAVDGFSFVIANKQGIFTFPDLTLGDYLLQAPGPSQASLIGFMQANGIDPRTAFTSGDAPDDLTDPAAPPAGDANQVLAAYQHAVQNFFSVDESLLTGLPMATLGGFGWNKVQLFQDATTVSADIKFLPQGTVSGRTVDSAARPIGAAVRVSALTVSATGFAGFGELSRLNSDPGTGTFSFGGVARFDLATFQAAAVRAGDFTLEAANPFSPAHPQFRGQLSSATQNLSNIVLQFPAASDTNGTVSGEVVMPDGATPAGAGTQVAISFGTLTVTTDANGKFASQLPIPAGTYTVTAQALNGLRGQTIAIVPPGGNVNVQVRLLGLGTVAITVKRPSGAIVPGAHVSLTRGSFPSDAAEGDADAAGVVRFVNITEGPFAVTAEEAQTGLAGRASGSVVTAGELAIGVVITASGRVTGTFASATGAAPIPFAQIALAAGKVLAYASTDAAGRFELTAIPVGGFTVEGFDLLTGRRGRIVSALQSEGQTLDVTILEAPRGTVRGVVVNADGTTGVPAARVSLTSSSFVATALQATALSDGSFRFDGVPGGGFTLAATDPVSGFGGSATGTIAFEGQIVDANVHLDPFGSLHVIVLDENGRPATNASVSIDGVRNSAVDQAGEITFEHLALGRYHLLARSLADGNDGGEADASIEAANQTTNTTVRFRGVGRVSVTVVPASGVGVVPSALVTLTAKAASGAAASSQLGAVLTGFTDATGTAIFPSVPVGDFFVKAEAAALAGVVTGGIDTSGSTTPIQVQLGASGTIAGRLLLPDGDTPAARAFATLRFQSQSSLRSGVLQITTGVDGTFEFGGIPLGSFSLSAFEVVSSGVQSTAGTVTADGQRIDLGDLILDNTGPAILQASPSDRSSGVDPHAPIVISFSEPVDPASLNVGASANVALLEGGIAVPLGTGTFSADGRTLTLQPTRALTSGALETITIKGAPDGPKDRAGLPLHDAFVSTFTVRDVIPPTIVSMSPAAGSNQVAPDAVVRVAFSEPVAGASIALRDDSGASVGGTVALAIGGTVAVFTPTAFLQPNRSYIATVANVADTAGNSLVGGAATAGFSTIDTIAPTITALQITGTPRSGATIIVRPTIAAADTQRVEYSLGVTPGAVSTQSPFSASIALPAAGPAAVVSAVAFDQVGNRSAPFSLPVTILPNDPPTVTLVNVSGSTSVGQGQHLDFRVTAADDDQLAQIFFTAVGSAAASAVQTVPAGQSAFTQTFSLVVPANAPSNSTITVQAAATDTAGGQSQPAIISLNVVDLSRPVVTISSPVNNSVVTGAQVVHVVIDATDDVALANVSLTCNPAILGCETRAVSPPAAAAHQTFDITIPTGLQAPQTVALSVIATDTSGNTGAAGRVLQIADTIKPSILSLESASGSTHLALGDAAVLRATVSDNVGVTALAFAIDGAFTTTGVTTVSPTITNGVATLSIAVPAAASNGATFTVHVRAKDAAGNASDEALLTFSVGDAAPPSLTVLDPAEGTAFVPGGNITVRVHATDDVAVRRFTLSVTGAFTATDTRDIAPPATPADATFVVAIPTGAAAGVATLHLQTIDTSGNASATVDRNVTIADTAAPQVQIVSPAPGARLDPRNPVAITITATDAVGIASMSFAATGTVTAAETRTVSPAASARTETFTVNVSPLPVAGGTLTFTGSARDAAGNSGTAAAVTVQLDDVVAPDVLSTTPVGGATGVDPLASISVRFTEPMNRATLTSASIQLLRASTVIPTTIVISGNDDAATLTPTTPLQTNTTFTIVVSTTATDRAGNPLTATRSFTFTTASPDHTSPRVVSIDPASNAVNVSLVAPIVVTFTEPVDASTVNPQTFKVQVGSTPVAGSTTLLAGNDAVRFAPSTPLPPNAVVVTQLTSGITDVSGNPLVAADGSPLATPLTFTFATARFSLVNPAGDEIVENGSILLEARADEALGAARVVFTVNGQAQPAVAGPPFSRTFAVGAAASTPTLTVLATALDGTGAEIARDQRTFNVVVGLRVTPALTGVPLGQTGVLRFSVSSALSTDLPIALTAGDPTLVTFPVNPAVLPAGKTFIDAAVVGASAGATAIIGSSPHGNAVAIVAVSQVQAGQTLTPIAPAAGIAVSNPASAGAVVVQPGTPRAVRVLLLDAPATGDLAVTVLSTNAAVATATATPVGNGQQTTDVQITALADGVATIIFRVGNQVRALTVYVGAPPAGSTLLLLARPAGVAVSNAPSAGQVITTAGGRAVVTVQLLNVPAAADTAVTVSTSNAAVASGTASVIHAGQTTTSLAIDSTVDGIATFTLRAGGETRAVSIFVGAPPANLTPILVARSIGVSVPSLPTLGRAFAPIAVARTLAVRLFNSPALVDTAVTVTTDNASVATAGPAQVRAGEQLVNLALVTGSAGTATLTIDAAGVRRELTIVVGIDPTPGSTAPIVAAPVGVTVIPNPAIGRVFGAAGSPSAATLGISLLDRAATASTTVTITSGNPGVVSLNGASTTTIDINTGDTVLQLPIFVSGTEGAALLTLEFNGQRRELLIVVGNPPASAIPAVTAPIVGIRIG